MAQEAAADSDVAAQLCLQGSRFREIAAFHCQQAAEKYLQAFLVRHQVEFPKTHDIAKLLDRVAMVDAGLAASLRGADVLSPFGVEIDTRAMLQRSFKAMKTKYLRSLVR